MKKRFTEFVAYMTIYCGMATTNEVEYAVHCCECGEPVYNEYPGHDWVKCPVCGYNIETEEIEDEDD